MPTVGTASAGEASATWYAAGWAGVANPMSVVATTRRSRCPAAKLWSTAGRVTVASALPAPSGMLTRTGATRPAGRAGGWMLSATSYSFTNSVASPLPDTLILTVGLPVSWSGAVSGADSNAADCPGMSSETPPVFWPASRPPMPGTVEIAAGAPPGGLTMFCAGPLNATSVVPVPARPG